MVHKPPSRIRYEKTHPVVTIRVRPDEFKKLQEFRLAGQSYADTFRVGLGVQETNLRPLLDRLSDVEVENLRFEDDLARCKEELELYRPL
jgi:hypothetical protein